MHLFLMPLASFHDGSIRNCREVLKFQTHLPLLCDNLIMGCIGLLNSVGLNDTVVSSVGCLQAAHLYMLLLKGTKGAVLEQHGSVSATQPFI